MRKSQGKAIQLNTTGAGNCPIKLIVMEQDKKTWGGKREGAGRKRRNNVLVSWRISPESREWIMNQAQEQGVPIGAIIDELVRSFVALAESE